jgi:TP901 family phage tail tape measure protein
MIEALGSSLVLGYLSPVALFTAAICLLVLRAGASRVFFDIVGTFQASKLIKDADSAATVFESLYLDAITGIQEAGQELGQIFNELTDAVVPVAREIEEAQIQLEKFVQEGENVEQLVMDVKQIGLDFGFAGDQAMEAAAKMAQISGVLGQGSLATGTEIGMRFGLISGMETEAAMQRMINLQQQTKFMTEGINENASAQERANAIRRNSMVILDELNTIENRSAATMEQITFVMNQFASQAHLANEEIRSMAALSAVMIETGEEQGKGGRALKMMYARLGSDIGGARQEMEKYGVSVTDAEGNMRPLSSMLKELEASFFAQSGAQQQNTAQVIAGNRHYTRFLKLMTNLDRVRQLEIEAAMRMFPAMDEINRRRESELFLLEQAEANVRNLSGALGEALLPAMTEITNKQAVFLETMVGLTEGPLGKMVTGMLALTKASSLLIGPVLNTIINFKNMSIAFQTHSAITRALAQQQDLVNNGFKLGAAVSMEMANHFDFQQQAARSLAAEEAILTETIKERTFLTNKSIEDLEKEISSFHRRADATEDATEKEIALAAAETRRQEIIRRRALDLEEQAESEAEIMQRAKEQASAYNTLTMSVAGVGSAMMLFGDNQKVVRAGMVLNTAAMGIQIGAMLKKNSQEIINMFTQRRNTDVTNVNTGAKHANAAGNTLVATTAGAATTATRSLSAALAMTGVIGVGIAATGFILTEILERIGIFGGKSAGEIEELNTAMVDLADVISLMQTEGFDTVMGQQTIDAQEAIIKNIEDMAKAQGRAGQFTVVEQEQINAANNLIELNREAINQLDAMSAAKQVLAADDKDLVRFAKLYHAANLDGLERIKALQELGFANLGVGGDGRAKVDAELKQFTDMFGPHAENIANILKENDFMADAAASSVLTYIETMEGQMGAGAVDTFTNSVEVANKTLTDFTNAREEMFHGFRADNLTGDLVRQVQQQGVETLITSTEVVMTNVFNGMTIPEMADLLIEEIEIRGRANGFNVTANVA